MKRVVLGVSGSIAAYRAADLARDLIRAGCEVRVCLTDAAAHFVTPILFESLTGQPCLQDAFEEPERGRMAHIDWARAADLVLVAPATANTLNALASGLGTDMLTTLVLATEAPLVVAPAMNPQMYLHASTQSSIRTLAERGATIVEPTEGDVACGENGQGKLAANPEIVAAALAVLNRSERLRGQRVLVTSGPTQEPIDDVRFLSNRSSGKMGAALAQAALLMGAEVAVVSGPTSVPLPRAADVVRVRTAEEMLAEARRLAPGVTWIVGAAAVADYRPASPASGKIRRSAEPIALELVPNPDIIATLAQEFPGAKTVAFAAEPTADLDVARAKMARKRVAAIVANDVSQPGIGFESNANALSLVWLEGEVEPSGVRSKLECALWLWERLAARAPL